MPAFITFLAIFWIVILSLLGTSIYFFLKSRRVATWPTVPVTFSTLEIREEPDDGTTYYKVAVDYAYVVNGITYHSRKLAFGYGAGDQKSAEEIHQALTMAGTVEARVNPKEPSEAVLTYGMHRRISMNLAGFGSFVLFLAGFSLISILSPWLSEKGFFIAVAIFATLGIVFFHVIGALMFYLGFRHDIELVKNLTLR